MMTLLSTVTRNQFPPIYKDGALNLKAVATYLGLSKRDLGDLSQIQTDSVRFDERMPEHLKVFLTKLAAAIDHVAEAYENDAVKVKTWFLTMNPVFDRKTPLEVILYDRVDTVLAALIAAKDNK